MAEQIVTRARDKGLPVAIYRPARITGHSRSGLCNLDDLFARFIKGCVQLGAAPILEVDAMDYLTPVDYVSKAIIRLSREKESFQKPAFHLSNPEGITFADIIRRTRSFGYPLRDISYREWRETLAGAGEENSLSPLLGMFTPNLFSELRSAELDCQDTLAELADSGVSCPSVDKLLGTYFSYFVDSDFLESRPQ